MFVPSLLFWYLLSILVPSTFLVPTFMVPTSLVPIFQDLPSLDHPIYVYSILTRLILMACILYVVYIRGVALLCTTLCIGKWTDCLGLTGH